MRYNYAPLLLLLITYAQPSNAESFDIGQDLYMNYCAQCHAGDAQGGGPLSEYLTLEPPKLTDLAAKNDGEFPMLEVIHIIDGRTGVRGHGSPMPIFGQVFSIESDSDLNIYGSVLETRGRMMSLALYLESIQE